MLRTALLSLLALLSLVRPALAIEEPRFKIVRAYDDFEIREYPPYLVAETNVRGSFDAAGDEGFRRLFDYISGKNTRQARIAMTAPVNQSGQTIEMAAPVLQEQATGGFTIQFVMPRKWTLETLPRPLDSGVRVGEVAAGRFAVIRYSGSWSQESYNSSLAKLRDAMHRENLAPAGDPVWARYDPPFMPWFLRRNEILIPLRRE